MPGLLLPRQWLNQKKYFNPFAVWQVGCPLFCLLLFLSQSMVLKIPMTRLHGLFKTKGVMGHAAI